MASAIHHTLYLSDSMTSILCIRGSYLNNREAGEQQERKISSARRSIQQCNLRLRLSLFWASSSARWAQEVIEVLKRFM
jgi:hypothetical protein